MQMTANAIRYTWRQLAQRAGLGSPPGAPFEALGLRSSYGLEEQTGSLGPAVIVRRCRDVVAWDALLAAPENSLDWIPIAETLPAGAVLPIDAPIPALFWGAGLEEGRRPFAERARDGSVIFNADILAASFFMLSRWEETVVRVRDVHERFPAAASLAYKQGFLDRPIVDEYAFILREWLKVLRPGWQPQPSRFTVKLSHDIDQVRRLATAKATLQAVGADLIKRRDPGGAFTTLRGSFAPQRDPYYLGISELAQLSLEHGFREDAFYFMTAEPGQPDNDYRLEAPEMRSALSSLQQKGFEIGLHSSYRTFGDLALLEKEKAQLERVLEYSGFGGRQHFLRFRAPDTWRDWEAAGLNYDSTLGYADHEGFRCGTCHPFRPFDIERDRELEIVEIPLVVMDGVLADYRKLTAAQGYDITMKLAQRCQAVDGTFTLLWHNSSLCGRFAPWVGVYKRLLQELSRLQGS